MASRARMESGRAAPPWVGTGPTCSPWLRRLWHSCPTGSLLLLAKSSMSMAAITSWGCELFHAALRKHAERKRHARSDTGTGPGLKQGFEHEHACPVLHSKA